MIITHYYVNDEAPFRRITELLPEQRQVLCSALQSSDLPIFARFRWEDYLRERERTEAWLRQAFLEANGKPEEHHPYYFVLGSSDYLIERYQGIGARIEVPLAEISCEHISFTFPDSMASRLFFESRDSLRYRPDFHGRIFLLSEVEVLLEHTNSLKQEKEYIEAQLWSRRYLTPYLQ